MARAAVGRDAYDLDALIERTVVTSVRGLAQNVVAGAGFEAMPSAREKCSTRAPLTQPRVESSPDLLPGDGLERSGLAGGQPCSHLPPPGAVDDHSFGVPVHEIEFTRAPEVCRHAGGSPLFRDSGRLRSG